MPRDLRSSIFPRRRGSLQRPSLLRAGSPQGLLGLFAGTALLHLVVSLGAVQACGAWSDNAVAGPGAPSSGLLFHVGEASCYVGMVLQAPGFVLAEIVGSTKRLGVVGFAPFAFSSLTYGAVVALALALISRGRAG